MWFFCSFSQENEKNNRATLISVKLISVALSGASARLKPGSLFGSAAAFVGRRARAGVWGRSPQEKGGAKTAGGGLGRGGRPSPS
jgi:hypothetical protein